MTENKRFTYSNTRRWLKELKNELELYRHYVEFVSNGDDND